MSNKHWYCVNQVGMATLCVDRQDAEEAARGGDKLWPQHAPHYVAKLEGRAMEQDPVAYAAFVGNGNTRIWTTEHAEAAKIGESLGVPLYTKPMV